MTKKQTQAEEQPILTPEDMDSSMEVTPEFVEATQQFVTSPEVRALFESYKDMLPDFDKEQSMTIALFHAQRKEEFESIWLLLEEFVTRLRTSHADSLEAFYPDFQNMSELLDAFLALSFLIQAAKIQIFRKGGIA